MSTMMQAEEKVVKNDDEILESQRKKKKRPATARKIKMRSVDDEGVEWEIFDDVKDAVEELRLRGFKASRSGLYNALRGRTGSHAKHFAHYVNTENEDGGESEDILSKRNYKTSTSSFTPKIKRKNLKRKLTATSFKKPKISLEELEEEKVPEPEESYDFELDEFRMLSVRQPWAEALLKNIKKIENRGIPIPTQIQPSWIVLHVSKIFGNEEKNYDGWYGRGENEELQKTCGKIIGLIRFKDCFQSSSGEGEKYDSYFTDMPKKAKFHWLVDKVIPLEEPIPHDSNTRFPRVSEKRVRAILTKLLNDSGETQYHVPPPKAKDKIFCEHCWKQYSKPIGLENHLKNQCEFTGDLTNKRKTISQMFLAKF